VADSRKESSIVGAAVSGVFAALAIAWAAWVFISPSQKLETQPDLRQIDPALEATYAKLTVQLSRAELRLEPLQGNNLDIYMTEAAFESVPYPDRGVFVDHVAEAWCGKVDGFFIPSVRIRDIKTGDELASRNCLFHSPQSTTSGTSHETNASENQKSDYVIPQSVDEWTLPSEPPGVIDGQPCPKDYRLVKHLSSPGGYVRHLDCVPTKPGQ
jgi:hypothetical protein